MSLEPREFILECGYCGKVLQRLAEPATEAPPPCPRCGATSYTSGWGVNGRVGVRASLTIESRPPGKKKFLVQNVSAEEESRSSGRTVKRHRTIDRMNDEYHEHVVDVETGETVHESRERLSDHRGHGSARKREPPAAG